MFKRILILTLFIGLLAHTTQQKTLSPHIEHEHEMLREKVKGGINQLGEKLGSSVSQCKSFSL